MVAPMAEIINISRARISRQYGHNRATVTFKATQDLSEWEVRADGYMVGTGDLVGGAVGKQSKGSNIINGSRRSGTIIATSPAGINKMVVLKSGTVGKFAIDANELTKGDKTYKIKIYCCNMAGEWSQ